MRYRGMLFNIFVLLSSGCFSTLISPGGAVITEPMTREDIHAQFGEPVARGVQKGKAWEDYHTCVKIADPHILPFYDANSARMLDVIEVTWLPEEVAQWIWVAMFGQDVRFFYDESGSLTFAFIGSRPHRTFAWRQAHANEEKALTEPGDTPVKSIVAGASKVRKQDPTRETSPETYSGHCRSLMDSRGP